MIVKKCKVCKSEFEQYNSLQNKCVKCLLKSVKEGKKTKHLKIKKFLLPGKLQREADRKFQIAGKIKYPNSIISGLPTEVGHHYIYKSQSNNTRYDLDDNFIPLTIKEHDQIHNRKSGSDLLLQINISLGKEWQIRLLDKSRVRCQLTESYLKEIIKYLDQCITPS